MQTVKKVEVKPSRVGVGRRKQPPSEEGGGTASAVTEGEKGSQFSMLFRAFAKFSLPQSASLTAPSSEGATKWYRTENFFSTRKYIF